MSDKKSCKRVFGQFIRTFEFPGVDDNKVALPIVQPGEYFTFPIPTIQPRNITYFDDGKFCGLIVPKGPLSVKFEFNTEPNAKVAVMLNGTLLEAVDPKQTQYGIITTVDGSSVDMTYLIDPPKDKNIISFRNIGKTLLTQNSIPNTRVGDISEICRVTVTSL